MPLYQTVTYTAPATAASLNLDPSIVPMNAIVAVTISGTVSYKLQYSVTPFTVTDANANWFDSTDIPAGTSTSKVSNITSPISRIRLVIATLTGGSIILEVGQGISTN